jgi:CheY-like chemotaxis protein
MMAYDTIHLLLVATDDDSTRSFLRAIHPYPAFPCSYAAGSTEAFNRLCGAAGYAPLPHPFLILVDLDGPEMEGLRFLDRLRHDPALRATPVFALAGARKGGTRLAALDLGVTICLQKRIITTKFLLILNLLNAYRFQLFPPDRRERLLAAE